MSGGDAIIERVLPIVPATPGSVAPYGRILGYDPAVPPMPIDFYGGAVRVRRVVDFVSDEQTELPLVTVNRRPGEVRWMERHFKHTQTFRLLALDLAGVLTLERLSDHLSDLACLLLSRVLRLTWARLPTRHRDEPRFAVVGYGKLGGKELGYERDLDIIFLYDDESPSAQENYARLAQRMNGMMNSHTAAGLLYETDLRLRPDGASGLLVSRLGAFEEYQRGQAWTWEHQALTRARFVAGDRDLGAAFETLRVSVLRQPRDPSTLRTDVLDMRARMRDGHPNRSGLFDIKHDSGGIVDVEFAVQYLVLAHAAQRAELTGNLGNIALLTLAEHLGLIPAPLGTTAADAYLTYRRRQHALRLRGERYARVDAAELAPERAAVAALWSAVFGR